MTPVRRRSAKAGFVSGWRLRRLAEEMGLPSVSDTQLRKFADWGLLQRTHDGYAFDSAERLPLILAEGKATRSLSRRVLSLTADAFAFPYDVPIEAIKHALVDVSESLQAPMRKGRRVARAWAAMAIRGGGRIGRRPLPAAADWPGVLRNADPDRLAVWVGSWRNLARSVLPTYGAEIGDNLSDIAIEERIVIVAVLHLVEPSKDA